MRLQRWVLVHVDEFDRQAAPLRGSGQPLFGLGAQGASLAGHQAQIGGRAHSSRVTALMRPVTAAVLIGLLVLIVGAFLWQLYVADVLF